LVCSQGNAAVERKLRIEGFRMGMDLILKSRHKPSMSSQLFAECISMVLLPYIDELRSNEEFADQEAVLFMDNCLIHVQAETWQMLADHRVKVITLPPHTTLIFECLDLSLFGKFKKKMNDKLAVEGDEYTVGFIKRIFHLTKQTFVEDNVRSAFMQLGLQCNIEATPYLLHFDEGVLRESAGFTSLWESDYPAEKVSYRR
jgi:hypothetical protein